MPYKDKGERRQWQLTHRHQHMNLGLCYDCNKPRLPNTLYCAYHYSQFLLHMKRHYMKYQLRNREYMKQRQHRLKEERKCVGCTIPLIEGEGIRCVNCNIVVHIGQIKGVIKYAVID